MDLAEQHARWPAKGADLLLASQGWAALRAETMFAATDAFDRFNEILPGVRLFNEAIGAAAQCIKHPVVRHKRRAKQNARR